MNFIYNSEMEVIYDFTGKTQAQVLGSYTSFKGWRTRSIDKVEQNLDLNERAFSQTTESQIKKDLANVEKYTDVLTQIANWLTVEGHANAPAHITETTQYQQATKALITRVLRAVHRAQPAALNAPANNAAPAVLTPKPVTDLKPDVLAFDASVAHVRRWKKDFEAYHSASNMRLLSIRNQQAFLLRCLDDDISARISRLSTATTPIFPQNNMVSCFSLLDDFFKERNPILMRRKTFFTCKQSSSQDELAFMEDVRSAADEGDIAGMSVEDAICLVYVIGVKDDTLRDKLSEVPDPNIEKFTAIMKSYVQSKITRREIASAAAISRNSQAPAKPGKQQSSSNPQKPRQQLSEEEKKRRTRFKGKCFRCGSTEHLQPNCPKSVGITCNICKQQGHMSSVCLRAAAARAVQEQPTYTVSYPPSVQSQPQLAHQQPLAVDYSDSVSTAYTAQLHNIPTPQAPL